MGGGFSGASKVHVLKEKIDSSSSTTENSLLVNNLASESLEESCRLGHVSKNKPVNEMLEEFLEKIKTKKITLDETNVFVRQNPHVAFLCDNSGNDAIQYAIQNGSKDLYILILMIREELNQKKMLSPAAFQITLQSML